MNNLDLLRPAMTFAEVVDHGSFRAAADHLGLSPAYVSQMIGDLEARLGRQLLFRSTRKISLTPEGEIYLTHARAMHAAFFQGIAAMRRDGRGLSGHLRISAPTVLASPAFAGIVSKFGTDHPELTLDITLDDAAVDPVGQRIDLAIRIGDAGRDPRLARKLFETRGVICVGSQTAGVETVQDLGQLQWLRTPSATTALRLQNAQSGRFVELNPKRSMIINNAQLIQEMLMAMPAFSIFPEFSVRERLLSGLLHNPLPLYRTAPVPVYALFTERRTALTNARAFVDVLGHWLRLNTSRNAQT